MITEKYFPVLGYENIITVDGDFIKMFERRPGTTSTVPSMIIHLPKKRKNNTVIVPINHEVVRIIHALDATNTKLCRADLMDSRHLFNFQTNAFENDFVEIHEGSERNKGIFCRGFIGDAPVVTLRCKKTFSLKFSIGSKTFTKRIRKGEFSGEISSNLLFGMVKSSPPNFWVEKDSVGAGCISNAYIGGNSKVVYSTVSNAVICNDSSLQYSRASFANISDSSLSGANVLRSTLKQVRTVNDSEICDSTLTHDCMIRHHSNVIGSTIRASVVHNGSTVVSCIVKESDIDGTEVCESNLNQSLVKASKLNNCIIKSAEIYTSTVEDYIANRIGLTMIKSRITG